MISLQGLKSSAGPDLDQFWPDMNPDQGHDFGQHNLYRVNIPHTLANTMAPVTLHGGGVGYKRTAEEAKLESPSYYSEQKPHMMESLGHERGQSMTNVGVCGMNAAHQQSDSQQTPSTSDGQSGQKSGPPNGKKTKGRVKIKMEFIDNKLRRYTTFSKRKTGIMKKAYELSTLTGTQVMLLVASETGHVYTFATRKLQPMITSEAGKALIQTCLNSPDPPGSGSGCGGGELRPGGDQRMAPGGYEEPELSYSVGTDDEQAKDEEEEDGDGEEYGDGESRSGSPANGSGSEDSPPPERERDQRGMTHSWTSNLNPPPTTTNTTTPLRIAATPKGLVVLPPHTGTGIITPTHLL
ncbi:unnamed protein product [Darwinula stevensoni]|uniref:Serum response factor homolog n=1 Tax=Darwinula stevensoni TaxID=69355 RepID=A0A7R8XA62_9CRUS|nr:unnamed protein product [Darwinula stevensoni]CAG0891698.1 unnamed protein product [Darwinula stevensoni]